MIVPVVHFVLCWSCKSNSLCAADCIAAPWNEDKPASHRLGYLLRQRRWIGFPAATTAVFFRRDRHVQRRLVQTRRPR